MITLAPPAAFVKPATVTIPAPVVAEVPPDDFGPADDSPLWDDMAADAAAMDAVCSGIPLF